VEAVIYARISKDRAGEGLGVARQEAACRDKASALGWSVGHVYVDNDVSASQSVPRPEYERLMANIEAGEVKALVVYDLDRLTRKPAELEHFITLADTYGIALANVSGDVDLTNANGRMIARIKGAVARQEAERIGERNKAQKAQRAAMGKPMGTRYRVYGYNRDWTVNKAEAAIVRDLFDRYIKGESQGSLTRWMQEQGHRTTAGVLWNARATQRLLQYATYAGHYVFKGQVIGKSEVPALVSEAIFEAANADRVKEQPGHNARRWLLSSILVCDLCKAPMIGSKHRNNGGRYRCNVQMGGCGKVSIKAALIDEVVNNYMSYMVVYDALDAQEPAEETVEEDNRLTDKDAEIAAIQESDLDLADKVALLKKARAERQAIIKEQAVIVERSAWHQPIHDYDTADLSVKRAAIRQQIQHIFIRPGWKTSREDFHKRFYVLFSETHRSRKFNPSGLAGGGAIDTYDLRERIGTDLPHP
jgi:site-specific DNA recombinase